MLWPFPRSLHMPGPRTFCFCSLFLSHTFKKYNIRLSDYLPLCCYKCHALHIYFRRVQYCISRKKANCIYFSHYFSLLEKTKTNSHWNVVNYSRTIFHDLNRWAHLIWNRAKMEWDVWVFRGFQGVRFQDTRVREKYFYYIIIIIIIIILWKRSWTQNRPVHGKSRCHGRFWVTIITAMIQYF